MQRIWRPLVIALGVGLAGCSASAPRPPPKPPARQTKSEAPAPEVLALRARLVHYLETVPDEGSLADALSKESIARLREPAKRLSDEQLEQWLATHPLLYALQNDPGSALLALAASDAAARELLEVTPLTSEKEQERLLTEARAVAVRAAAQWLRAQAPRIESGPKFDVSSLELIDRVAETLGRSDIRLTLRQLASEVHASTPGFLALADSAARAGDFATAESALKNAQSRPEAAHFAELIAETARVIALLNDAGKNASTLGAEERLRIARDLVHSRAAARALPFIEADAAVADHDLRVATTLALAELDGDVCPGLPPALQQPALCALAWRRDDAALRAVARVERAYRSGGGRDRLALTDYLGLSEIVPWQYAAAGHGAERADGRADFEVRLGALERKVVEATRVEPAFEALGLFLNVLRAGLSSSGRAGQGSLRLPAAKRDELVRRASALGKLASDTWGRRALLGVAALLADERSVEAVLTLLPERLEPEEARTRATLRRWEAVAERRPELAALGEGELTDLLLRGGASTEERAKIVLFMAETAAAFDQNPKAQQTLAQIGRQLSSKGGPGELRLRALLDAAGSLARLGRKRSARELLAATLPELANAQSELWALARGYELVLRIQESDAAGRKDLEQELERSLRAAKPPLPKLVSVWLELWRAELTAQPRIANCRSIDVCEKRERATFRRRAAELTARLNPVTAQIVPRALAASSVSLSLQYRPDLGLVPVSDFAPWLLSLEFPPDLSSR